MKYEWASDNSLIINKKDAVEHNCVYTIVGE